MSILLPGLRYSHKNLKNYRELNFGIHLNKIFPTGFRTNVTKIRLFFKKTKPSIFAKEIMIQIFKSLYKCKTEEIAHPTENRSKFLHKLFFSFDMAQKNFRSISKINFKS